MGGLSGLRMSGRSTPGLDSSVISLFPSIGEHVDQYACALMVMYVVGMDDTTPVFLCSCLCTLPIFMLFLP